MVTLRLKDRRMTERDPCAPVGCTPKSKRSRNTMHRITILLLIALWGLMLAKMEFFGAGKRFTYADGVFMCEAMDCKDLFSPDITSQVYGENYTDFRIYLESE